MKIPVFVSGPTKLNKPQEKARERIIRELARLQLEPRALGRTDYPSEFPLREVFVIAKHCSGGIILGFQQFIATAGIWKKGTKEAARVNKAKPVHFQLHGIILKLAYCLACSYLFLFFGRNQ